MHLDNNFIPCCSWWKLLFPQNYSPRFSERFEQGLESLVFRLIVFCECSLRKWEHKTWWQKEFLFWMEETSWIHRITLSVFCFFFNSTSKRFRVSLFLASGAKKHFWSQRITVAFCQSCFTYNRQILEHNGRAAQTPISALVWSSVDVDSTICWKNTTQ